MTPIKGYFRLLIAASFIGGIPAVAQMPGAPSDPLARIREAAKTNVQACSATGETLCEQVAPKIVANAEGESPLVENLGRLIEVADRPKGKTPSDATPFVLAVAWAEAAFRSAGIDVHTEKHSTLESGTGQSPDERQIVVGEIRGREKPDEWVLLGAHLDSVHGNSRRENSALDDDCNAALAIEAARDIQLTGIRPRRSIRFVIFMGQEGNMAASWAYVRAHQSELDRASAAILISAGAKRVKGYTLNGRHDIETGLRDAMKPIDSMSANNDNFLTPLEADSFDFLIEGIPTIVTQPEGATAGDTHRRSTANPIDRVDIKELKRNAAIVAVTAFGIAERAQLIGPRQSRAEIGALLTSSGLEQRMKAQDLWPAWESGKRGRTP